MSESIMPYILEATTRAAQTGVAQSVVCLNPWETTRFRGRPTRRRFVVMAVYEAQRSGLRIDFTAQPPPAPESTVVDLSRLRIGYVLGNYRRVAPAELAAGCVVSVMELAALLHISTPGEDNTVTLPSDFDEYTLAHEKESLTDRTYELRRSVSPLLANFASALSTLPVDLTGQLMPLVGELLGTGQDDHEEARAYLALDWQARTWLPAWLQLVLGFTEEAGFPELVPEFTEEAKQLASGPPIRSLNEAMAIGPLIDKIKLKIIDKPVLRRFPSIANKDSYLPYPIPWRDRESPKCKAYDHAWSRFSWGGLWGQVETVINLSEFSRQRGISWYEARSAAGASNIATKVHRVSELSGYAAVELASGYAVIPTSRQLQQSALDLFRRMVCLGREGAS